MLISKLEGEYSLREIVQNCMDYIFLLVGFFLLIKGADYFVDGSSSVAKIFRIPTVIIGLTVVACGTSLPELAVSLTAALEGSNELAIGNVVGSNVFNSLIVLGTCAFIAPIKVPKGIMKNEFPFSIFVTLILVVSLGGYRVLDVLTGRGEYALTRLGGLLLLVLFIYFIVSSVKRALDARKGSVEATVEEEDIKVLTPFVSGLLIVCGAGAICLGGTLVVNSASAIGESFGLSQSFIGLTIVALGTSLPEYVTSVVAARKGENDMAIGNVIGSNIFNILLILGVSASVSPISVSYVGVIDTMLALLVGVVVYIIAATKSEINKKEGLALVFFYVMFFIYITFR